MVVHRKQLTNRTSTSFCCRKWRLGRAQIKGSKVNRKLALELEGELYFNVTITTNKSSTTASGFHVCVFPLRPAGIPTSKPV